VREYLRVVLCVLLLVPPGVNAGQDGHSPLLDYRFFKNLTWNIGSASSENSVDSFNRPLSFLQKKSQISIRYFKNNIIDRDAINFNSSSSQLLGVYRLGKLIPLETVVAFSVDKVLDNFTRQEAQDEVYRIGQNRESYNFALSTDVLSFLSIGLGSRLLDKNLLSSYEIKLETTPYFTTWYRAFTEQNRYVIKYQLSDDISSLDYQPFTKLHELELQVRIPGIMRARYMFNPRKSKNRGFIIYSEYFQKMIFSFAKSRLYSAGESIVFFNNRPGNEIAHNSEYSTTQYTIQYFPATKRMLNFSFSKKSWLADAQGELDSSLVPFLTSLLAVDDRSFNANLAWQEKNYLVEYKVKMSKRYSIKTSFEWLRLQPSANLVHWISPPLFNIIKFDKKTTELIIQQLDIVRINIEAGLRYKSIITSFTLGQMIPLQLKYFESEERDSYSVGAVDIKSISSRLKKNIEGYRFGFQIDYLF